MTKYIFSRVPIHTVGCNSSTKEADSLAMMRPEKDLNMNHLLCLQLYPTKLAQKKHPTAEHRCRCYRNGGRRCMAAALLFDFLRDAQTII